MHWLLAALGIQIAGGLVALVAGRSARLATLAGAATSVAGCAMGLAGLAAIYWGDSASSFHAAWDVPYGSLSLEVDPLSAFFSLPVLVLSPLAAVYASGYLMPFSDRKSLGGLWFSYNLLTAGMLTVTLARNGVLFLVAWEVMSLAAFFLITFDDEQQEVRDAGRTFLIATHLSTAALLVMFVLLGHKGASLDFAEFTAGRGAAPAALIFLLAVLGFGTKAGLMPLGAWLPEAYPVAPSFVSAVMSAAMSKLGIYGLLRILLVVSDIQPWWGWLLVALGAISAVLGILAALAQNDLKRLLAYSSIENLGIITMGIGLAVVGIATGSFMLATLGFAGALFHVLNHAMLKGLLFLGAGAIAQSAGTRQLDLLGGLLKRMPWTGAALVIGSVAIAGLPPLNAFASEFLIYSASLGSEGLLGPPPTSIVALAVIGSLALAGGLAAFCFAKAIGIALLGEPRTPRASDAREPAGLMVLPLILLAAGCAAFGLLSPLVVDKLMPVVAQMTHQGTESTATLAAGALGSLAWVARMSGALVVIIGGLAAARKLLLAGREVTASGTWGCGYARPTPRIQYTASSFTQPAVEFFGVLVRSRRQLTAPTGLFPRSGSLSTSNTDMSQDLIYRPMFDSIGLALSKLRWLQHGRIHLYILYVGCTLLALVIWYVSVELAPESPERAEAIGQTTPDLQRGL